MMNRENYLNQLISMSRKVCDINNDLAQYPWDSVNEMIFIRKEHIYKALKKFLHNEINADELELWANAIEGRDDIGYEKCYADELRDIIFKLANPEIAGEATKERVKEYLHELEKYDDTTT